MTTTPIPTFADVLRQIRGERGVSQHRFAELIDVDSSYVSRLESGDRHPGHDVLGRCAAVLTPHEMVRLYAAAILPPDVDARAAMQIANWLLLWAGQAA